MKLAGAQPALARAQMTLAGAQTTLAGAQMTPAGAQMTPAGAQMTPAGAQSTLAHAQPTFTRAHPMSLGLACARDRWYADAMKLALKLYCAVVVSAGAAEEVKTIEISPNVKLQFKAEKTVSEQKRELSQSGYVTHKGKLYYSHTVPPDLILTSGEITIDGKQIVLDVSGLANPWLTGDRIHTRFVRLDRSFEERGLFRLTVVFAKGGAEDYLVEWDLVGDKCMRTRIAGCGDRYPEWVSPAAGDEK